MNESATMYAHFACTCYFIPNSSCHTRWMRSGRVVRASNFQCQRCNSPGLDPSILRHSRILGAAHEAVLNKVRYFKKFRKSSVIKEKRKKRKYLLSRARMRKNVLFAQVWEVKRGSPGDYLVKNTDLSLQDYLPLGTRVGLLVR
jgi:hypothetical protein